MIWKIKKQKTNNVIDQLLINRGIDLDTEKEAFLNPKLTNLNDPKLLPDIGRAVEIFLDHCQKESKVGIFADYDADGIPGGVLLKEVCDQFKINSFIYIPTREEGYGLSEKAIDYFLKKGVKLLITIDCGVADIDEVDYAKKKGLEVIILDHHETKEVLPDAQAVVNAKRKDSKYPFREISGAAVGFKFAQAISKKSDKISNKFIRWSLDLIGISTIADMVPLVDENRIFAKWGIEVLKQTKRPGLIELYNNAGINRKTLSAGQVGFQIGPRINAPGRMDHANQAFYLLIEKDPDKARKLASKIEKINRQRQIEIETSFNQAVKLIEDQALHKNNLILIKDKVWSKGTVGLVASKIVEKYFRPAIVLSENGRFSEGSARSIPKLNILKYLDIQKRFLERYGGHSMAAGLKIENSNFEDFYDSLVNLANENLNKEDFEPILNIDRVIEIDEIDSSLYSKLSVLEPHGIGNPRPTFASRSIQVSDHTYLGSEKKHLKLIIPLNNGTIEAISFNSKFDFSRLENEKLDIAYTINENNFRGETNLQLNIKNIKLSNGKE